VSLARNVLLAVSTNAWVRERAMKTAFVRRSVSSFMPGERLEDALGAAALLQREGVGTILTKLGENLTRLDEAEEVTSHYLDVLDRVSAGKLSAEVSIKPTQLGLDLDKELCYRNLERLVDRAASRNTFVWIDMESSPYVDPTIELFRRAKARTPRVGLALQAYLRRTERDVEALIPLGSAVRLVKGAYLEPASVAFPRKADVDENYYRLACRLLTGHVRLHIATHDSKLVERIGKFIEETRVPRSVYEYAMLYGIQRPLQRRLAASGKPLRVLISYGEYWFPWYMRRLAERPANVGFVIRNMFAR
jgi:proline dehydrogenase